MWLNKQQAEGVVWGSVWKSGHMDQKKLWTEPNFNQLQPDCWLQLWSVWPFVGCQLHHLKPTFQPQKDWLEPVQTTIIISSAVGLFSSWQTVTNCGCRYTKLWFIVGFITIAKLTPVVPTQLCYCMLYSVLPLSWTVTSELAETVRSYRIPVQNVKITLSPVPKPQNSGPQSPLSFPLETQ